MRSEDAFADRLHRLRLVPWRDCRDLDSTVGSLADAIGTTSAELARALREHDEGRFEEAADDPWELMPREVVERFSADVATVAGRFDGAYYFHGTRAVDPVAFRRRGILPLDQMLEELWATLRELAVTRSSTRTGPRSGRTSRQGAAATTGGSTDTRSAPAFISAPSVSSSATSSSSRSRPARTTTFGCPEIVRRACASSSRGATWRGSSASSGDRASNSGWSSSLRRRMSEPLPISGLCWTAMNVDRESACAGETPEGRCPVARAARRAWRSARPVTSQAASGRRKRTHMVGM
jgi:hypothetical protein